MAKDTGEFVLHADWQHAVFPCMKPSTAPLNAVPTVRWQADDSGGIGVMGVLVGALIVIVVGGRLLFATGTIGSKSSTGKLELPKVTTVVK